MGNLLRQELEVGYFKWLERPGEDLGVFDNEGDFEECRKRVHCNCSHWSMNLQMKYEEESSKYVADISGVEEALKQLNDPVSGRHHVIVWGADHNNVYFPSFTKYKKTLPECLMQGINGEYLELHDPLINGGEGIPMPAIDDETLITLNCEMLGIQAEKLKSSQYVKAYMLGMEELYPEYFGLGNGDFRPASWKHFEAWCERQGCPVPAREKVIGDSMNPERMLWLSFREQAMADRCGNYYEAVLKHDENHLIFYPTHGSTMCRDNRSRLGQQPGTLACQCDGMEMGHIMVENDEERRNVLLISHFASFGSPVIVPRLGNKRVDLNAIGGGKSFNAPMLRRLVYECLGMGVSKIFPIHWTSRLHDGEWFIKNTEAETECRKVFDEITFAAPFLTGMARLQPQAGILAGNAEWIKGWKPEWTGFMQDAFAGQYHMTLISDEIIGKHLAARMPVIFVLDNAVMKRRTFSELYNYAEAGGHLVIWGNFAINDENQASFRDEERRDFLHHKNIVFVPENRGRKRVLREFFLSGPEFGVFGERFVYQEFPFKAICAAAEEIKDCILRPFDMEAEVELTNINIYPLTDRKSLAAVCINNGEDDVEFTIRPDRRLIEDFQVYDICAGKIGDTRQHLNGGGTKILWFCPKNAEAGYEDKLMEAEDCFEKWRAAGADVSPYRYLYSHMRTGSNLKKRAVMADVMLHTLAVSTEYSFERGKLYIICKVFDSSGEAIKNAGLSFRLSPGDFEWQDLKEDVNGYTCTLDEKKLPVIYDVKQKEYVRLKGTFRMIIRAEKKEKQGGSIINVYI